MRFGDVPIDEATGAVLAHSVRVGGVKMGKGRVLSDLDVDELRTAGVTSVIAARLDPEDVSEDEAATRVASACVGDSIEAGAAATGRVNLHATARGVLVYAPATVDTINAIDESVTIACLPPGSLVEAGQMVATVKIIPFAVPGDSLKRCESVAAEAGPALMVAPLRPLQVGLIQTKLGETSAKMLDKTARVTAERIEALGGTMLDEVRCAHDEGETATAISGLVDAGAELVVIAGASAITDRRDTVPAAITRAGGRIEHFGMPVDPGNLLLLAALDDGLPVVGLPGCARSPKLNGFDWVLWRLFAGVPVTRADIMAMGVGGLLTEIPTRPRPREGGKTGST